MDTKEKILNASKELFSKFGYKKVSMDEVAASSGVTKKTVYSYFNDKETLVKALITIELESMMKKVDEYSKHDLDFFDFTNKTMVYLLKYRKQNKLLVKLGEELEGKFSKEIDNQIIDYIKSKLNMYLEKDKIEKIDLDLCSFIIYKIYLAVMFEWPNDINEEKVTKNVTQILKTGLFN